MRTIKYIILAALAVMLASCTVEPEVTFGLDLSEIKTGPDGGSYSLNVSSGNSWVASTEASWITISPANGSASELCTVKVDSALVNALPDQESRTAEIYIQDQKTFEDRVIKVTQDNYGYFLLSDKVTFDIPNFGEYGTRNINFNVRSNHDFTVKITYPEGTTRQWLLFENGSSVSPVFDFDGNRGARPRNVPVHLTWDNNSSTAMTSDEEPQPRSAVIEFIPVNPDGGQASIVADKNTVEVIQEAAAKVIPNTRQADSTAIVAIANIMNISSAFDSSTSMDMWDNVTLWEEGENIGRVRSVTFSSCHTLEKECIPFEVSYLTAVESLTFYSNDNKERYNFSTGPYLAALKDNLKRLTIAYFGLTELDPSIKELVNLEYLNLAGNNFQSIPEELAAFGGDGYKLHALLLNTNYRTYVYDLSNAANLTNLGGLHDTEPDQLKNLLLMERLDTLTLGMNYLRGELPTFMTGSDVEANIPVYDDDFFNENSDEFGRDSLDVLTGMPRILPRLKLFTINGDRFVGEIPDWLLYHPRLDWMDPFTLIFPQEGIYIDEDDNKKIGGFTNRPVDFDYYYDFFKNKPQN